MYTKRGKKYIYSVERANDLIQYGCRCIETGFNAKCQRFYWTFIYDEVQPFYEAKEKLLINTNQKRIEQLCQS